MSELGIAGQGNVATERFTFKLAKDGDRTVVTTPTHLRQLLAGMSDFGPPAWLRPAWGRGREVAVRRTAEGWTLHLADDAKRRFYWTVSRTDVENSRWYTCEFSDGQSRMYVEAQLLPDLLGVAACAEAWMESREVPEGYQVSRPQQFSRTTTFASLDQALSQLGPRGPEVIAEIKAAVAHLDVRKYFINSRDSSTVRLELPDGGVVRIMDDRILGPIGIGGADGKVELATAEHDRWTQYARTYVDVDLGDGQVTLARHGQRDGEAWSPTGGAVILTAFNPGGKAGQETNLRAQLHLIERLREIGVRRPLVWYDAVGRNLRGDHSEPSVAVVGLTTITATSLAREFGQDAYFEWRGDRLRVVDARRSGRDELPSEVSGR